MASHFPSGDTAAAAAPLARTSGADRCPGLRSWKMAPLAAIGVIALPVGKASPWSVSAGAELPPNPKITARSAAPNRISTSWAPEDLEQSASIDLLRSKAILTAQDKGWGSGRVACSFEENKPRER